MARQVKGEFAYLVNAMNEKGITIKQAAELVDRDMSTIYNWLRGRYFESAVTVKAKRTKVSNNPALAISKITGDSLEIVRQEIRNYLEETGVIRTNNDTVVAVLEDLVEQIEDGRCVYIRNGRVMTDNERYVVKDFLKSQIRLITNLANLN